MGELSELSKFDIWLFNHIVPKRQRKRTYEQIASVRKAVGLGPERNVDPVTYRIITKGV